MSQAANFKIKYGEWINPKPSFSSIARDAKFVPADQQQGRGFAYPFESTMEHGVTFTNSDAVVSINPAISANIDEVYIQGSMIISRVTAPLQAFFKSSTAGDGSQGRAFRTQPELQMSLALENNEFYRDLALSWGTGTGAAGVSNIGVIKTTAAGAISTARDIFLTKLSYMPAVWRFMTNAQVDIYQSDATTLRVGDVTVQSGVPVEGKTKVTFFKSGSGVTPQAGDIIVPKGALTNQCYGLDAIFRNTGTLFTVNAATNPLFRCQSVDVSGAMSRDKVLEIGEKSQEAGNEGNGGILYVCGKTLNDLARETLSAAQFIESDGDSGNDTKTQGASNLKYRTGCGVIEVKRHRQGKQGQAMFVARNEDGSLGFRRVGATDTTMSIPGDDSGPWVRDPDTTGENLFYYAHQAPFLDKPAQCVLADNIANSTDAAES